MIKNKNLQMGLFVFFITLITLITFIEFYPEDDSNALENQSETIDKDTQEKLEVAIK